jgi:hypothetical protein
VPLSNDKDKSWTGWLVNGLGGREAELVEILGTNLVNSDIPKTTVRGGTVNMWWRKDSRYVDVTSTLDGTITSTIHVQEYGRNLWIGRAVESFRWTDNYYKRMAIAAFIDAIDICISQTLEKMATAEDIRRVSEPTLPVRGNN